MIDTTDAIRRMIAYYRARSSEYDEWFLRQNRYDRGPELNRKWFQEVAQVREALDRFEPTGTVLELACGTGLWTHQLLNHAEHMTAVDASPEVLGLNRERLRSPNVEYVHADIFTWQPPATYDLVFFSFWLSHVPADRFEAFWQLVGSALKPGGRVFFVDSRLDNTSTARDHSLDEVQTGTVKRRLNDGREFEIVKVFYDRLKLQDTLRTCGWDVHIRETAMYFLYGSCGSKEPKCGNARRASELGRRPL